MNQQWKKFVFISLLLLKIGLTTCQEWNYHDLGPDMWSETYPTCSGNSQSPINIKTACTTYRAYKPFEFSASYNITLNFTILNVGHGISSTYDGNESIPFTITGADLNGTFYFSNFHLHWDENSKSGSEHQVNGMKYAGEIHFVHTDFQTGRIAVLAIFIHRSQNESEIMLNNGNITTNEWDRYFTAAAQLNKLNDSTVVSLNLASLLGTNLNYFWRYRGSFTTPPCTEGVIWTVFKTPIIIKENQLDSFRKNILLNNYRSPQPLYNRKVYRNFLTESLSTIPDYNCCIENQNNLGNKLIISKPIKYFLLLILVFFVV